MRTELTVLVAILAACGSAKPYQRVGSPEVALATPHTAACIVDYPYLSVNVYYKGRQTGGWFSGLGRNIGSNIDRGKNQNLLAAFLATGIGEHTRDSVGDSVEPIIKQVSSLTIRDWMRLPDSQNATSQELLDRWPELDRVSVHPEVYLYAVPDDRAVLKLEITLTYLQRRHGELHVIWREAFVCESTTVTHEALEADGELAIRLMRDCLGVLEPWIRWELTAGKNRLAGKPHEQVTMQSGAELEGIVLARSGSHVVVRGDEGLIRAIAIQYVKSIDALDE